MSDCQRIKVWLALAIAYGTTEFALGFLLANNYKNTWCSSSSRALTVVASHGKSSLDHDETSHLTTTRQQDSLVPQVLQNTLGFLAQQEELWSTEWHDSFVRNGFVDFCPPLSSQLHCLLVGNHDGTLDLPKGLEPSCPPPQNHESWRLSISGTATKEDSYETGNYGLTWMDPSHDIASDVAICHDATRKPFSSSDTCLDKRVIETFDCILDRGLMNDILAALHDNHDSSLVLIDKLLLEACRLVREHGIYVMTTRPDILTPQVKEYLFKKGKLLGMEWQFALDGISDHDLVVSVARRFRHGTLFPTRMHMVKTNLMP